MKKTKTTIGILLFSATISFTACKNDTQAEGNEANKNEEVQNEVYGDPVNESSAGDTEAQGAAAVIDTYLQMKDALVADNSEAASAAAGNMLSAFEGFSATDNLSSEEQDEMKAIVEDAVMHAEHIVENVNNIEHQREHFDILSVDMIDMIAIVGTEKTLYRAFCPMYNEGEGAVWLTATEEIKNPYFGSKMLTCGEIQQEI